MVSRTATSGRSQSVEEMIRRDFQLILKRASARRSRRTAGRNREVGTNHQGRGHQRRMSWEMLSPKFHNVSFSRTIEKVNHASAGKVAAPASSIVEEAPEYPRPARVLELAQRLGLDLADALARHRELQADLFQRVVGVHADAEAHAQHALLARRE